MQRHGMRAQVPIRRDCSIVLMVVGAVHCTTLAPLGLPVIHRRRHERFLDSCAEDSQRFSMFETALEPKWIEFDRREDRWGQHACCHRRLPSSVFPR